jgi:hypothetical protein
MSATYASTHDHYEPGLYEIRPRRDTFEARWSDWFDGLIWTHGSDGTTIIYGPVVDQAGLHGVLHRLLPSELQ